MKILLSFTLLVISNLVYAHANHVPGELGDSIATISHYVGSLFHISNSLLVAAMFIVIALIAVKTRQFGKSLQVKK